MSDPSLVAAGDRIKGELETQGYDYLHVRVYGRHLIIYSEFQGEKENRARFTALGSAQFRLDMANYRVRWEATPYIGTLQELLHRLLKDFGYVLTQY